VVAGVELVAQGMGIAVEVEAAAPVLEVDQARRAVGPRAIADADARFGFPLQAIAETALRMVVGASPERAS